MSEERENDSFLGPAGASHLVPYCIYSRISRKINEKIMPQKWGGNLSPGLY